MIEYGIVITTYQRQDGKTKGYLTNTLESVKNQTYQNYKVFLIGDKYENNAEFYEISEVIPRDKIIAVNLPYAKERDKYANDIQRLHHTGGTHARNVGIEMALLSGVSYILNLDHDDTWEPDHIQRIDEVLSINPDAVFVCTKSHHINEVLPKLNSSEIIQPFYPLPCGIIHSATCINFREIPLRYEDAYEVANLADPGDAYLWVRLRQYMVNNNLNGYVYNKLTCYHFTQGEAHGKTI